MELPDRREAKSWEGLPVVDRDEQVLGVCRGVFADTDTGVPEWFDVDVQGHARSFVPALDATEIDGKVRVGFTREQVLAAPHVGDAEQLSKRDEMRLYDHYGVEYTASDSDSLLPADVDVDADTTATTATTDALTQPVGGSTAITQPVAAASAVTQPVAVAPAASAGLDDDAPHAVLDATPQEAAAVVEPSVTTVQEQTPVPTAVPTAVPPTSGRSSSSLASAGAPLGAVAALAAAVGLGLQARERRRKRNAPVARADRLKATLQQRAALAARLGNEQLATLPDRAQRTRGQLSDVASTASVVAAKRSKELRAQLAVASDVAATRGKEARVQLAQASEVAAQRGRGSLAKASETAAKRSQDLKAQLAQASEEAAKRSAEAKKTAAKRSAEAKKTAGKRSAGAKKTAARSSEQTKRSLLRRTKQVKATASTASDVAARSTRKVTAPVAAAPKKVAKKGRRARRSVSRNLFELLTVGSAGAGYVLGARAGEQRYEEITARASQVAAQPQVEQVLGQLQRQVSALRDRRGGSSTL